MAKRLTRDDLADQVAELEEQNCPPVADSRSRLAIYGGGTATRRDYLRHFAYVDSLRRADF